MDFVELQRLNSDEPEHLLRWMGKFVGFNILKVSSQKERCIQHITVMQHQYYNKDNLINSIPGGSYF